jgi:hypothetical protein
MGRKKKFESKIYTEDTEQAVVCCKKGTEKNEEKKELRRRIFPVPYSVQNYLDIIGKLEFSVVFVLSYKVCTVM